MARGKQEFDLPYHLMRSNWLQQLGATRYPVALRRFIRCYRVEKAENTEKIHVKLSKVRS